MKAARAMTVHPIGESSTERRRQLGTWSGWHHVGRRRVAADGRVLVGGWGAVPPVLHCPALPSALYDVYQAQWKFSTTTLTAVFAIYALFPSRHLAGVRVGRRLPGPPPGHPRQPLITAVSCALFLAAGGVGLLFVARALQGVAVGLGTEGIGAALIDLQARG